MAKCQKRNVDRPRGDFSNDSGCTMKQGFNIRAPPGRCKDSSPGVQGFVGPPTTHNDHCSNLDIV